MSVSSALGLVAAVLVVVLWGLAWHLRSDLRQTGQNLKQEVAKIVTTVEQQNRYEFYRSTLNRTDFLLLYGEPEMWQVIREEVGPERWHDLVVYWRLDPTRDDLGVWPGEGIL